MRDVDQQLADLAAAGRITADDVATVQKFREFLAHVGPASGPLTEEQRAFRRHCHSDPEWRAYLGIANTCMRCGSVADHDTDVCCSAHGKKLCHACYRQTHFVEICGCGRPACIGQAVTAGG